MIKYELDEATSVLHVRPTGPLQAKDFDALSQTIDPFIERTGKLHGLILETERFPGWEDLGAAVRHFRFVHNHHRKISRVAIVTDSHLGDAAEHIASHFVAATIRHFGADEIEKARAWVEMEA